MTSFKSALLAVLQSLSFDRRAAPSGDHDSGGDPADWLPPVLGPCDWPVGFLASTEASWYHERYLSVGENR